MKVYQNVEELIGKTPLLSLKKIQNVLGLKANVFAKLECFNPAGSVKDRVALSMIKGAEEKGILKEGGTVIEPTSGNTGIGIASICASRGYKAVLVMPDTMSVERIKLLKAYGAEVVLTSGEKGMQGAIEKATLYLIPLEYTEEAKARALLEAKEKIQAVVSPTSLVEFEIAEPSYIKLTAYLDIKEGYDIQVTKTNIITSIKKYINSIAPGDSLYLGDINKLGLSVEGVEYFNIVQLFNNNEELADFELLQTITAKFLFEEIIWWEVEG